MLLTAALFLSLVPPPATQDDSWPAQLAAARALELPSIGDEDVARWRELVVPTSEELGFEEIPWKASLVEGLRAAEHEGKPLLFWAMNGHPLGCT